MSSPWKRIVIDSRYKTRDSKSDSDFHVELPYAVEVPKGSTLLIEGVTLSHSWPTVQAGVNQNVFVQEQVGAMGSAAESDRIVTLAPGAYNSVTLAAQLQTQLNATSLLSNVGGGSYQYTVSVDDGRITVSHNIPNSLGRAYLYPKDHTDAPHTYLSVKHGASYPMPNGQSANELLGYLENTQTDVFLHSANTVTFAYMDLQRHKQIFLCSDSGLGETAMMTLSGNTTVLRRILVGNNGQGDIIVDTLQTAIAGVVFQGDTLLTRLHFFLLGWDDKPIHTGGHQVSFEMVIQKPTD